MPIFFPFHFFLQSNQNLGYELRTIWTKSFEGSWEHLSFPLWSCVFAYKEFVHSITMTSKQFWFQSIPGKKSYHDQLHSVNFSVDIIAVFFFYLKWFTFWSELFWSCSTPLYQQNELTAQVCCYKLKYYSMVKHTSKLFRNTTHNIFSDIRISFFKSVFLSNAMLHSL